MNQLEQLQRHLDTLGITVTYYTHPPFFTAQEGIEFTKHIPGMPIKNLFLKDDKKRFWLICIPFNKQLQIKAVAKQLEAPGLRFAKPDDLMHYLGVTPGSVTPLAMMNDREHIVRVILDQELMAHDLVQVHPLQNDMSATISPADLKKYITACGSTFEVRELAS